MSGIIQPNVDVVNRLFGAYAPKTIEDLVAIRDQFSDALRVSMKDTTLYTTVAMDAPLMPGLALASMVHPFNVAAVILHAASQSGRPVADDLALWTGEWSQVKHLGVTAIAPIIPSGITTLEQHEAKDPNAFANADVTTAAAAAPTVGQEQQAPATQEPAQTVQQPTSADAQLPLPGTGSLPPLDFTRAVLSASGRSQKSPFDRVYRARERIGKIPSWWAGTTRYLGRMFAEDPAELVPVENSPQAVMEYGMALDLMRTALSSAPSLLTAGELLAWVDDAQARIGGSLSGAVAFDLSKTMAEQVAAAAKGGA